MRLGYLPYNRLNNTAKTEEKFKISSFINLFTAINLLLLPVSFLLGRASIAGGVLPFGMAIFASAAGMDCNKYLIGISVIFGMITRGTPEQIYITIAAMFLFSVFGTIIRTDKGQATMKIAILALISTLIPEIVIVNMQGFLLFDFLKALFHGVLIFLLIFIYRNAISGIQRKTRLNNEEIISIAILTAVTLAGLADIQVMGVVLKDLLSIIIILICGYKCGPGVGAASGVTIGLVVSLYSPVAPYVIGSYAIAGLLTGTLRKLGKIGASLGFVLGSGIFALYINGSTEILLHIKEIVIALLIFMLIPNKVSDSITTILGGNFEFSGGDRNYTERIKEITVDRLNNFSNTFKELSKTFCEISETKTITDKEDISVLFDRVADRVCKDCCLCLHCWDRNFYNTYQVMFKIVERLEEKGRIENKDIPKYFMDRCERVNDFVLSVNNVYELFKVDMVWKSKISESRELVSQQLEGLSKVVSNLANEIGNDVNFDIDLENSLKLNLEKAGIKIKDVNVMETKWGTYEASITHKGCGGKRICINTIEKIATDILSRKMVKETVECIKGIKDNSCTIKLIEEEIFSVTTGVSKLSKYNSMVSGDNYTFLNTGNGKYVVALSDGMGSGHKAAVQSRATISMLEQFMESGFDKDTSVKLINSVLVLKSDEDSFSTIDMSVIDLYNGEVEFVKTGAVSTFIKREEKVDVVRSATLPAGILSNIETEILKRRIDNGEFLILVTDGVLDAFKKDNPLNDDNFIKFVNNMESKNPQEIADLILNEAYKICDSKPIDDMLAVVAKVWKKVS
ncbi:MAG: stage II sporulation protein E [Bacillota bacterium]|nr:stage II sporulation protein E [Bacillota bacterium]